MNLLASAGLSTHLSQTSARTMTARALLLLAGLSAPAFGQFRDWQIASGDWSLAGNWSPNGVPLSTETARIGNHASAQNDWVSLDQNDTVAGLQVSDGMMFDLEGFQFVVNGDTLITGQNQVNNVIWPSRVRVNNGAGATDFQTHDLTLADDAWFEMEGVSVVRVLGELSTQSGCGIYAEGTIHFQLNGVRALNNNSIIQVTGPSLTLNQTGTALMDLDGSGGTGYISLGSFAGNTLHVFGTALSDAFSSSITMAAGSTLNMGLTSGWTADSTSDISAYGGGAEYPEPIRIMGWPMTVGGELSVSGSTGHLRIQSPATIVGSADVSVGTTDLMTFENNTTIEGGAFVVSDGGELRFEDDTLIQGGTFTTPSGSYVDGGVAFAGLTDWFGNVTINGAARQNADATVIGNTVIDAVEFDMDGGGGVSASTWDVNANLVVNADRIDQADGGSDVGTFNGTMNVASGFLARFTFNAPAPDDYWWMAGAMNLTGDPVLFVTRLAGTRVHINGDLNVVSGKVHVDSDLRVLPSGHVNVGPASAILRTGGHTILYPAQYTGLGTIQNGSGGVMSLSDGCDLDQLGLENAGDLTLSNTHTLISVDRFAQTSSGILNVTVGGYTPGVEHDLLVATDGTAQLDGQVRVTMPDFGGDQFYPQPGDEFVVITADDGIVGSFDFDPITYVDDLMFKWVVEYNAFNVTLRLESVVPACPGDVNGDGLVNGADLSVLLAQFGANIEQWSGADLNGDGWVNGADLSVLLSNFGNNCVAT